MNCIQLLLRTVFIIRDLLWQRILDILCISMILLLMTGICLLTMLLKKVYAYDYDGTNCNDTCTANVIRELCHDRDTYHYPVKKDSCSEFNDFLKALCTL